MTLPHPVKRLLPHPVKPLLPLPRVADFNTLCAGPQLADSLFPDEEPRPASKGPDYNWTDPYGRLLELWVVDYGRGRGCDLTWKANGKPMRAFRFGHPDLAHEYARRWHDSDTQKPAA